MAAKKGLLGFDADKRRETIFHIEDGKTFVETRQDCQHIVDAAKVLADEPPDPSTGLRFIGYIPDTVWNQAVAEGWIGDKERWRQWMQDPDNRAFTGGIRPRF
jgi:hypothetical protein